jgi:hypothetical protein
MDDQRDRPILNYTQLDEPDPWLAGGSENRAAESSGGRARVRKGFGAWLLLSIVILIALTVIMNLFSWG